MTRILPYKGYTRYLRYTFYHIHDIWEYSVYLEIDCIKNIFRYKISEYDIQAYTGFKTFSVAKRIYQIPI